MRETGGKGRRPSPYPRPVEEPSSRTVMRRSGGNRKRYIAGLSVAAVVAAATAGMMTTGNAYAEGGDDTVVFNGHCGLIGLGQASEPDKESMSVTDEDKVTFVNNLGTHATLLVGQEQVQVPEGGEYTTVLGSSTEAVMAPDCVTNLTERANVVTVTVTEAPEEEPAVDDHTGNDTATGDNGGSATDNQQPTGDGNVGSNGGHQPPMNDNDPAAEDTVPETDADADIDEDAVTKDDETETSSTTNTKPTTGATEQVEAVDVGTIEETGSSGLLAILATISLVGVAVAAIRTIRTQQRTT